MVQQTRLQLWPREGLGVIMHTQVLWICVPCAETLEWFSCSGELAADARRGRRGAAAQRAALGARRAQAKRQRQHHPVRGQPCGGSLWLALNTRAAHDTFRARDS